MLNNVINMAEGQTHKQLMNVDPHDNDDSIDTNGYISLDIDITLTGAFLFLKNE